MIELNPVSQVWQKNSSDQLKDGYAADGLLRVGGLASDREIDLRNGAFDSVDHAIEQLRHFFDAEHVGVQAGLNGGTRRRKCEFRGM